MSRYLSHSQVETITDCGEKFRLTRMLHVGETPAFWNAGGRAVHGAIEYWEGVRFSAAEPSIEETVEEFHRIFEHEVSEAESAWRKANSAEPDTPIPWRAAAKGVEDDAWWREHGAGMVRAYILQSDDDQTELASMPDGSPALEVEFMIEIAGVPFKGFIDQVRQPPGKKGLRIRDLKAGKRTPTSTAQLGEYGVAYSILTGKPYEAMTGDYYMARTARSTAPIALSTRHPRTDVEYAVATAWMMKSSGLLLPRPSSFCVSCAVKTFCRYTGGERANEVEAPSPPFVGLRMTTAHETINQRHEGADTTEKDMT